MRFCSYSSVIFYLSHCISKELFFVVYSDDHKPSSSYPSLEEEILPSSCFIDVDPVPSFEIHVQHDIHIPISLDPYYSGHLVENEADLLPSTITAETCEQLRVIP